MHESGALTDLISGTHPIIQKIERALEDVLSKLQMPALESYANEIAVDPQVPPKQPASEFQTTRENSREPAEEEKEMAPAPMGSLYEATQLTSLRTRLRRVHPRKRHAKRRMDADMVSQNLLSVTDAEELLNLYVVVPNNASILTWIDSNDHCRDIYSILRYPKMSASAKFANLQLSSSQQSC